MSVGAAERPSGARQWLARPAEGMTQGVIALILLAAGLLFIVAPVLALLVHSLRDGQGQWVGLAQYARYLESPALLASAGRSLRLATLSAVITTGLAFVFAYALTQSAMAHKRMFRAIALVPLLAPSLLVAIALVYLFGNQGLLKGLVIALTGGTIYGETGIVLGSVLWTFPHALLVLVTSLSTLDGRLVEAARSLGARPWRIFLTVTLPASRYGLLMSLVAVFVLVITDFGVAKVVGGQANVLATDLYKQVVGQQNFPMGAVVSALLLLPALGAFLVERHLRVRQGAALSARAVIHQPQPQPWVDRLLWVYCAAVSASLLAVIGVAVFASLATYWPYDLTPTLKNYDFDHMDGGGWGTYWNSLRMALATALVGTALALMTAWAVDKGSGPAPLREALNLVATLPLAVPGLALGLGYILFFNAPSNPLGGLYASMAILVTCTVVHGFSVAHLALLTALRQLDDEFDRVAQSLGVPFWRTLWRVYLPVCLPAVLEVAGYFFVNAMTTVSAVVFLYAPHTQLASVAVLNMDDAGDVAPAAAMAVLIFLTAGVARLAFGQAQSWLLARTQRWRQR